MNGENSEMAVSAANFSARLRALREGAGISLRRVASMVGITPPFLSDIELGRRMPSRPVLKRLAKALNVAEEDLLKFDPREGLAEILAAASANPRSRAALADLCRKLNSGNISVADLKRVGSRPSP